MSLLARASSGSVSGLTSGVTSGLTTWIAPDSTLSVLSEGEGGGEAGGDSSLNLNRDEGGGESRSNLSRGEGGGEFRVSKGMVSCCCFRGEFRWSSNPFLVGRLQQVQLVVVHLEERQEDNLGSLGRCSGRGPRNGYSMVMDGFK